MPEYSRTTHTCIAVVILLTTYLDPQVAQTKWQCINFIEGNVHKDMFFPLQPKFSKPCSILSTYGTPTGSVTLLIVSTLNLSVGHFSCEFVGWTFFLVRGVLLNFQNLFFCFSPPVCCEAYINMFRLMSGLHCAHLPFPGLINSI